MGLQARERPLLCLTHFRLNLGFWPAVQSASSAMGTPRQMRNTAGAAPPATAVPGNGPRQQDQRRGEQPCGVMLRIRPMPMQVLPHASLASHGERQLHEQCTRAAGGAARHGRVCGPAVARCRLESGAGQLVGRCTFKGSPRSASRPQVPRPSSCSSLSTPPHKKSGLDACAVAKAAAVLSDRPRARPRPYAESAHLHTFPSTSLLGAAWQTP